MNIVGLIAEFNPFHNGHAYLIEQIRKKYHADMIICVMSGHFLQRGEPAIINKWDRAKIACLNGIDMVIELPYIASVQPAELFAREAVTLLNHCGINHLAFGCEATNVQILTQQAQMIKQSQAHIYYYMQQGYNYAQATKKVLPNIKLSPNNILALAYIKAIQEINTNIKAIAIKRVASNYHDASPQHKSIASATAIRNLLGHKQSIQAYLPILGYEFLLQQPQHVTEDYWPLLKIILARTTADELSQIYDMREGLEQRFLKYWQQAQSMQHFLSLVTTKRYSKARIQRCCCHILTNTHHQFVTQHQQQHFQVLALNSNGRKHLKYLKKFNQTIKLHTNINQKNQHYFNHDIRVTQVYDIPTSSGLNDLIMQPFIKNNDEV